jgi:hypothetical protein
MHRDPPLIFSGLKRTNPMSTIFQPFSRTDTILSWLCSAHKLAWLFVLYPVQIVKFPYTIIPFVVVQRLVGFTQHSADYTDSKDYYRKN